jgi:hypothetical protein
VTRREEKQAARRELQQVAGRKEQQATKMGGPLYSLVRLTCNTLYPAYASFKVEKP